jgi:hypothetical protein
MEFYYRGRNDHYSGTGFFTLRLSQNLSFWDDKLCLSSSLGFRGKSGLPATFSRSLAHRTRGSHRALLAHGQLVLGQAPFSGNFTGVIEKSGRSILMSVINFSFKVIKMKFRME